MRRWLPLPILCALLLLWWTWPPTGAPSPIVSKPVTAASSSTPATPEPRRRVRSGHAAPSPQAGEAPTMPAPQLVRCALPPEVVEQAPGGKTRVPGRGRVAVRSQGAWLEIPAPVVLEDTTLRVDLEGWATTDAHLRYAAGGFECQLGPLIPAAVLTGRVVAPEGISDGRIQVFGCGRRVPVDRDGGFFLEVEPGTPCVVRASRRDGAFTLRSPPVEVTPGAGQEIVLDMTMPPFTAAGVGTTISETDGGILVERVLPDSPAERGGLRQGDVIIALDGEDVSGWTTDEFIDIALGPEDTPVTYTVLRDGQRIEVPMVRQRLTDRG